MYSTHGLKELNYKLKWMLVIPESQQICWKSDLVDESLTDPSIQILIPLKFGGGPYGIGSRVLAGAF